MLAFIKGNLISKNNETAQIVVLAQNVGYEVILPRTTLETVHMGQDIELWLHTHVREDILALYGFLTDSERLFFRILIGVSGLGPKTGLALVGMHGVTALARMILEKNIVAIKGTPGVGQKLAEKIVLELSNKMEKLSFITDPNPRARTETPPQGAMLRDDLQSALQNLGYPPLKVKGALEGLFATDVSTLSFEDALKRTLKEMYRRDT